VTDVGLFIPCYVDQCYPEVGLATVKLLERLDCPVDFPEAQTCCGQPMAWPNVGRWRWWGNCQKSLALAPTSWRKLSEAGMASFHAARQLAGSV
jgi:heterodisulfide reductase subunit B